MRIVLRRWWNNQTHITRPSATQLSHPTAHHPILHSSVVTVKLNAQTSMCTQNVWKALNNHYAKHCLYEDCEIINMYAWRTWIWEKREAKAHLETTGWWWRQQQNNDDNDDNNNDDDNKQTEDILTSHTVEHAVSATVCIKVIKLRGQEEMPIQNYIEFGKDKKMSEDYQLVTWSGLLKQAALCSVAVWYVWWESGYCWWISSDWTVCMLHSLCSQYRNWSRISEMFKQQ